MFVNYTDIPGMSSVTTETVRKLLKITGNIGVWGGKLASTAADAGNSGQTSELRTGLVLGQVAASKDFKQYDPDATDGTQFPFGILLETRKTTNQVGTAVAQTAMILISGHVYAAQVINLDPRVRAAFYGRILFDDQIVTGASPGWMGPIAKAADYTVTEADSGYHFTTLGASGAIVFTLPTTLKAGFRVLFTNEVDQNMTITAPANKLVAMHNLTATSVAVSTANQKIGGGFEIYVNSNQTKYMVRTAHAGANTTTVA